MAHRAIILYALAGILAATPVWAETECRLENARYVDASSGAVLAFTPLAMPTPLPVTASSTNGFTLALPDTETVLHGVVSWNQGLSRPTGTLGFLCGDPSVDPFVSDDTGNFPETPFCPLWEGVVYALDGEADGVVLLPEPSAPPPRQIVLADLGQTLFYGQPDFPPEAIVPESWGTTAALEDVFSFDGCAL